MNKVPKIINYLRSIKILMDSIIEDEPEHLTLNERLDLVEDIESIQTMIARYKRHMDSYLDKKN